MCFKSALSLSSIFLLLDVLGNFGVSDADVGFPAQQLFLQETAEAQPPPSISTNNKMNSGINYRRFEDGEYNENGILVPRREGSNPTYAFTNPSEWFHIPYTFHEGDWPYSRNLSTLPELSNLFPRDGKSGLSISKSPKLKFSYHRVHSSQNQGRPIAAVTLTEAEAAEKRSMVPTASTNLLNNVNPEREHSHYPQGDEVFGHLGSKQGRHHHHQHERRRNNHHHQRNNHHHNNNHHSHNFNHHVHQHHHTDHFQQQTQH